MLLLLLLLPETFKFWKDPITKSFDIADVVAVFVFVFVVDITEVVLFLIQIPSFKSGQ